MAEHNDTGNEGEQMAQSFLEQKGWKVLYTNWRFGKEEIDIIAQRKDILSFVEVKTRKNNYYGNPESFVAPAKQKRIIRAAAHFMETKGLDLEVRFDIVSITLHPSPPQIEHLEDAFSPRW